MTERRPQFAFALSQDTKDKLEDVARVLGKSQASVLTTAIEQLYESLPKRTRTTLHAARAATAR
jgi:hypothetical protein